jgi:hypothetical protein
MRLARSIFQIKVIRDRSEITMRSSVFLDFEVFKMLILLIRQEIGFQRRARILSVCMSVISITRGLQPISRKFYLNHLIFLFWRQIFLSVEVDNIVFLVRRNSNISGVHL